ncbi:MAG: DEAD/DEAH box helicase family protein [Candidatus Paralactobacillus gallistercoris]|uniref:DEAD/DEAH box helicase family protein n=1 Tax=Candidatus Paralactobacillus gallistercoris TaxID=2838724 RepID=A0A948X352_9LACO|nr:DEAD/DEAH box helicase family protein [Candidatus Paralactobacillus gallistercoris]
MPNLNVMYGRQLLLSDIERLHYQSLLPFLQKRPALVNNYCQRCHYHLQAVHVLPNGLQYCPNCLALGRITTDQFLYYLPEKNAFVKQCNYLQWQGQLTAAQAQIATTITQTLLRRQTRLIWAVTGAGKTEMLFQGIAAALARGWRVAIAAPRVDVCLELYPRLQQAFTVPISLLHGKQKQPYQYTQLVLCTIHQLWRFYHAFDAIIVDEVDAFPLADDTTLQFAIQQARKVDSACLYLTATPSPALLRQINYQQLKVSYLPLRYHQQLLPVPRIKIIPNLAPRTLPWLWRRYLQRTFARSRPLLIFVPYIRWLPLLQQLWQQLFPKRRIACVYANDPQRLTKITAFRQAQIDVLITTTILERGVTFKNVDVLVYQADAPSFSIAALVQIAGRVGRYATDTAGIVVFLCKHLTINVKQACCQIKTMNCKAKQIKKL